MGLNCDLALVFSLKFPHSGGHISIVILVQTSEICFSQKRYYALLLPLKS